MLVNSKSIDLVDNLIKKNEIFCLKTEQNAVNGVRDGCFCGKIKKN